MNLFSREVRSIEPGNEISSWIQNMENATHFLRFNLVSKYFILASLNLKLRLKRSLSTLNTFWNFRVLLELKAAGC